MSTLDHPLICELLEVYVDVNFVYFVNPFYTGGELHDLMFDNNQDINKQQYIEKARPIPEDIVKPLIYQILRALNYLK